MNNNDKKDFDFDFSGIKTEQKNYEVRKVSEKRLNYFLELCKRKDWTQARDNTIIGLIDVIQFLPNKTKKD